jgi:hypothetical protein
MSDSPTRGFPRRDDHRIDLPIPSKEHEGEDAVEVADTMGAASLLRRCLVSDVGSALLGETVKLAADVDLLCGAGYGERTGDRVNSRKGHRDRRRDTRAGTITSEIPKLRKGSYLLSLLEPGRRGE